MRKAIVILIVFFGVFVAIGCAGQKGETPNQTVTPAEAVTPAENYTATENKSATGSQNITKHISSTQRKKARILENVQAGNNTSSV